MKKVMTINIAGRSFYIDEDAYNQLEQYLKELEVWSNKKEGGREVFNDIEMRIRELLEERINPDTGVITSSMVSEIKSTMGEPGDFTDQEDDDDTKAGKEKTPGSKAFRHRRLYRDMEDRVLGGVCSGIAAYFNIDRVLVRVLFAILPFLSFGAIIPIYIILWIAIPPAVTSTQRLEMSGHDINISNIEKKIRDEYNDVKNKFRQSSTYKKGEDYLSQFNNRDRTALIVTAVVVGVFILANLLRIPFDLGFLPATHLNMPFWHFSFPSALPIVLILLILGLVFRSAFKGFLILILVVLLGIFLFKILGLFAWPVMHSFL